jgi:succinyl-CoA synthetase beta subunit
VAVKLGISPAKQDEVAKVLLNLYDLFLSKDASMVEINPFAEVSTIIRFF